MSKYTLLGVVIGRPRSSRITLRLFDYARLVEPLADIELDADPTAVTPMGQRFQVTLEPEEE